MINIGRSTWMAGAFVLLAVPAFAAMGAAGQQQPAPDDQQPTFREQIEVVATRVAEAPHEFPGPIEVIDGDTLRSLGATTLNEALAMAAGVAVAPGGDAGPAGSVPEFRGLREFDAFLLVVDDIPWGGAFNPALTTLALRDVERIEILRGPAPVTYGATSFVGVIHVVHKSGASRQTYATVHAGSFGSGGGALDLALPQAGGWVSRLSADGERQGFSGDRTSFARGRASWRGAHTAEDRRLWAAVDLNVLRQAPAGPQPRVGKTLTSLIPIDSNQNPTGAFLDDTRVSAAFGMDRSAWHGARWTTSGSLSHSGQDAFRGFLSAIEAGPANSAGFREQIDLVDVYADTHLAWSAASRVRLVAGGDFLHGSGNANGAIFTYSAPLSGRPAPVVPRPSTLGLHIDDRREFFGGYVLSEWDAAPRVRITSGLRLNIAFEEGGEGAEAGGPPDEAVTTVRPGGSVGILLTGWQRGLDHVKVYASYRNTFKPAAVDFGLGEAEPDRARMGRLKPETALSYEAGVKARGLRGRIDLEGDLFVMDFRNLVTATTVGGLPALMNTGTQRLQGIEIATDVRLPSSWLGRASYSFHDAHFTDFAQVFDGVPVSLNGNRLEMSARHLWSGGLFHAPSRGLAESVVFNYTGSRYLNRRNTAPVPGFVSVDAGVGYQWSRWEARLDGRNLGDRRDPVSESELGDAQYYRMPARHVVLAVSARF